jgi:hypothetical protein
MGTATGSVYFGGFPPQDPSGGSLKSEFLPPFAFSPVRFVMTAKAGIFLEMQKGVTLIGHNRKQPAVEMSFPE